MTKRLIDAMVEALTAFAQMCRTINGLAADARVALQEETRARKP